jgi:drug/metabolite transporter (DMT)-like permease
MIVLREKTTRLKTLGVVLAFAGGALVALDASSRGQAGQAWGDVVCTVSAFTYGVYTVALQKLVPNDDVCRCVGACAGGKGGMRYAKRESPGSTIG